MPDYPLSMVPPDTASEQDRKRRNPVSSLEHRKAAISRLEGRGISAGWKH